MRHWALGLLALSATLLLAGCLWSPGKFKSDLIVRNNGTFVLDYRGEILLQRPEDKGKPAEPWSDSMARCFEDGRTETISAPAEQTDSARRGRRRGCPSLHAGRDRTAQVRL